MLGVRRWAWWAVAVAACGYVAFLALYVVLRVVFWDRLSPVAFLTTFVPWLVFPVFLLPLAALALRRWATSIGAVVLTLVAGLWLYLSYWNPQLATVPPGAPGITIMTMNVGQHLTSPGAMRDYLTVHPSNVVCMQELVAAQVAEAWPSLKTQYPYQAHSPLADAGGSTGIGIVSSVPIQSVETFSLRADSPLPQQRIVLRVAGRDVALYNIHTTTPRFRSVQVSGLRLPNFVYAERIREAWALADKLRGERLPILLCGDLNMTEQAQDFAALRATLTDSFRESGTGFGFTWPVGRTPEGRNFGTLPFVGIDHIMHSTEWAARNAQVMPPIGSDHVPLKTEIFLTS